MKTIPNAQTALPPFKGKTNPPTYADLLKVCLDNSQSGFTVELMRKRLRVAKAIEEVKAGDEIKLEDADYETAQEAVKSVVWVASHPAYVAFAEAFGV